MKYLMRHYDLLRDDHRLDFAITQASDHFSYGVKEAVEEVGVPVIPFELATQQEWDMALFATHGGAEKFGRVGTKVHIQHGLGGGKAVRGDDYTYGRFWSMWGGHPTYDLMLEANPDVRARAVERIPELADRIVVVGDLASDNALAARQNRDRYRQAFGIASDETALLLVSTWGPHSLLESRGEEVLRAAMDLPDNFVTLVTSHPHLWVDGDQISGWGRRLNELRADRVRVCGPYEDWAPYVAAADVGIIDHSSQALFFSLMEKPTIAAPVPDDVVNSGSPIEQLRGVSPRLDHGDSLLQVIRQAQLSFDRTAFTMRSSITAHPRESAKRVLAVLYDRLGLAPFARLTSRPRGTAEQPLAELYATVEHFQRLKTDQPPLIDRGSLPQDDAIRTLVDRIIDIERSRGEFKLRDLLSNSLTGPLDNALLRALRDPSTGRTRTEVSPNELHALGAQAALEDDERAWKARGDTAGTDEELTASRLYRRVVVKYLVQSTFDIPLVGRAGGSAHAAALSR